MPARTGEVIVPRMATKTDFTEEEWAALQKGVTGAGMFVSISQPGFTDSFSEASALAKHLGAAREHSDSALIRDIASAHGKPFGITDSPGEIEQKTTETLGAAVAALQAKAPEEVDNYRQLVLDVAQSVAEASKGVSDKESDALEKIRAALG